MLDLNNLAVKQLQYLKGEVKRKEEAVRVAEKRLEKAQRDFERAIANFYLPGVTPAELRKLLS